MELQCLLLRFLHFLDYLPFISQLKALLQLCFGCIEEAKATQENFISLIISLFDPFFFNIPCAEYYCAKPKPCVLLEQWMKNLDDSTLVTYVNMPGTHDSGCRTGGEFARCQTWSIGDQLKAGIRVLDMRCRVLKSRFQVVHGIVNCHLTFDTVIKYCEDFLRENPSEFIIMRIRKEAEAIYSHKTFNEIYREYASRDVFYKGMQQDVTVAHARGKILIIKSFDGDGTGYEWPEGQVFLQDNFLPESVAAKLEDIVNFYENAKPHRTKLHVNVLSACKPSQNRWPRHYARRTNKMMLEILQDEERRHFGGIVAMDFPGKGLVAEIIKLNCLKGDIKGCKQG